MLRRFAIASNATRISKLHNRDEGAQCTPALFDKAAARRRMPYPGLRSILAKGGARMGPELRLSLGDVFNARCFRVPSSLVEDGRAREKARVKGLRSILAEGGQNGT